MQEKSAIVRSELGCGPPCTRPSVSIFCMIWKPSDVDVLRLLAVKALTMFDAVVDICWRNVLSVKVALRALSMVLPLQVVLLGAKLGLVGLLSLSSLQAATRTAAPTSKGRKARAATM